MHPLIRTLLIFGLLIAGGFAAFLLIDGPSSGTCTPVTGIAADAPGDPTTVSVSRSAAVWPCADRAVVADADDVLSLALGASLADAAGVPFLASSPTTSPLAVAELDRLGVGRVFVIGGPEIADPFRIDEAWDPSDPDQLADLERHLSELTDGAEPFLVPTDPVGVVAAARAAIAADAPLSTSAGRAAPSDPAIDPGAPLWVTTSDRETVALASLTAADASGAVVLLVDAGDPRRSLEARAAARDGGQVALLGDLDDTQRWQARTLFTASELPGGGLLMFEPARRLVALYGNPNTDDLGVLGEQGPKGWAETATRLEGVLPGYDADGIPVLPSFEIIATVAAAGPGDDGNYSAEMAVDALTGWVDYAAAQGMYVVLDLQPGRSDFLTQAQRYESLLRLPHVGLALDPEWRLGPDQVHLEQVGSVSAAEINTVVDWLAGLVRDEGLPQKLLLLHQFRFGMISERETLHTPPELAMVIQMDGQGPLDAKYLTWDAMTEGTESAGWRWGWKNFFDEDSPMATPSEVLALDPTVWFVSFQ